MYNRTNPAVIKSILLRLSQNELLQEIEFIKSKIIELEPGNKRNMFWNLYFFSTELAKEYGQYTLEF